MSTPDANDPPVRTPRDPSAIEPAIWQSAASFAARMHAHHVRKDHRTPYFAHPARVAMILRDRFGCAEPEAIAAAYLHDTLEDTPADYDDLQEAFGTRVADLVAALSKNMLLPEPEREADYDRRLAAASWLARLVKLADVYDNACDLITRGDGTDRSVRRNHLDRIDRAVALASGDAQHHPETAAALAALRAVAAALTDPG
ncbi:MAG: HD domain-containing protein [Planctomycetota bacterium]